MRWLQGTQSKIMSSFLFVLLIGAISFFLNDGAFIEKQQQENEEATYEVMAPQTIEIRLERVYLDGETSQEHVQETVWSMDELWAIYEDWVLVDQNENELILRSHIDDISPLLKVNGYFGLTDEGVLSIFEGEPSHERVIQSFFQIDTAKLKSKQHSDLEKGIPVRDLLHYEEVLQVFGQYKAKEI